MNPNDWTRFAAFANELADAARIHVMKYFKTNVESERKNDQSPVSIADRETEQLMCELISRRFPDHGIVGEEFASVQPDSDLCWVLDPIDGTKSFLTGKPTFGILIALLHENTPVLGVIDSPVLHERWLGINNHGSTHNANVCNTNKNKALADAWIHATTIDMFDDNERLVFDTVTKRARGRLFGADCYAYGLLASGHTDIVMEAAMGSYDYLALVPVVENAGGCVTDWDGKPLTLDSGSQVVATANEALHEQILDIIKNA